MPMVAAALSMTDEQRAQLEEVARSSVLPHRKVVQARALLWAGEGVSNEENARCSGVSSDAVRRWRNRFQDKGIDGVGVIASGRGRKPWLPAGTTEQVLEATRAQTPPGGTTQWSTRTLAAHLGIGKDAVAQIWRDHGLKPWKVDTFKISTDPNFSRQAGRRGRALPEPARAGRGVQFR